MRLVDISGQTFNHLTVLRREGKDSTGKTTWLCQCICGNNTVVSGLNLKSGNTMSCGCLRHRENAENLTDKRFGRLKVLHRVSHQKQKAHWLCLCDCGNTAIVWSAHLLRNHTLSCGCLMKERSSIAAKINIARKKKENHPRWISTLSNKERDRRRDTRHKEWSAAVLKRASYKCEICLSKGELHAHHLDGYREFPSKRYDLENGVCLCKNCHCDFHKAKGFTRTTTSDFYLFFNLQGDTDAHGPQNRQGSE